MDDEEFENRFGLTPQEARDAEREEFASFSRGEQLHIIRSLRMATDPTNLSAQLAADILAVSGRTVSPMSVTLEQILAGDLLTSYVHLLPDIRNTIPQDGEAISNAAFLKNLIFITLRELERGLIERYPPLRFLYLRLVGPEILPFLPSAFLAAVSLPRWDRVWSRSAIASVELEYPDEIGPPPQFFPAEPIA